MSDPTNNKFLVEKINFLKEEIKKLKAEEKRLRKAGDAMYDFAVKDSTGIWLVPSFDKWSKEFHSSNKDKGWSP
jgi:hypothetical protein